MRLCSFSSRRLRQVKRAEFYHKTMHVVVRHLQARIWESNWVDAPSDLDERSQLKILNTQRGRFALSQTVF
jgi:hypothetical protein